MFSNAKRLPSMPRRKAEVAITISMYVAPASEDNGPFGLTQAVLVLRIRGRSWNHDLAIDDVVRQEFENLPRQDYEPRSRWLQGLKKLLESPRPLAGHRIRNP